MSQTATSSSTTTSETVFTYASPRLKFGAGASAEVGHDLAALGVTRALLVTDPGIAASGVADRVAEAVRAAGLEVEVYAEAHVEPSDASLRAAVEAARAMGPFDGVVAVGGGSSIDTAKAVDLMLTSSGDLLDYVNAPVGGGRAPEKPLLPLVAVPTTAGTGAESTSVCVLDVLARKVKTGISHERLRPVLAVVDPELSATMPAGVTAASGLDILCHALESYTARPYDAFPRKEASERVPYCGANPIADMWSEKAMSLLASAFRRAYRDGEDREARLEMSMAATFAGLGFGNAGVHLPHANAYPVAGGVPDGFHPAGYPDDHAMVPHGMAVALTAPESFRFTFEATPERHLAAARLLAPQRNPGDDARDELPSVLVDLLRDVGQPSGLAEVGYAEGDVPQLVEGTMAQARLLSICPRTPSEDDVAGVLARSMHNW
ncbi:hydroxyacid-oxoacid transhydrogenase [Lapillicoccus jejuensis]|uniref:hydroxyacid-oxoacid transhydrogenase n=1 Tax=Lapillicoccus jejuensis TaxID=402171 RepID=A0A542DYS7_9MICO|nr:hydroxyacid-oxoacid transhydrogenase [Lapillicoccus jejuensis]TQJ08237.1 alcohol dehydrogenase class IV [Lapillicoccus jejuensis]